MEHKGYITDEDYYPDGEITEDEIYSDGEIIDEEETKEETLEELMEKAKEYHTRISEVKRMLDDSKDKRKVDYKHLKNQFLGLKDLLREIKEMIWNKIIIDV